MIRVGVIGYGYWGPNIVRNFQDLSDARVVAVSDLDEQRLAVAVNRYPHLSVTQVARELIEDPELDLIVVTTPASTHYALAKQALETDHHVLVAKPLATTVEHAEELLETAVARSRVLAVDHTFVYNPAVGKIRELVRSGEIGEPYYYDSTRVNLGLIQNDANVLWDLATHDFSILDFVFAQRPVTVSARAFAHIGVHETVAYIFCRFEEDLVAHINVNWLAPTKVRLILVGGSRRMIVYDDNDPMEKVRVYDRGVLLDESIEREPVLVQYRTGDMFAPWIGSEEALRVECEHMIGCIERGCAPMTDGAHALRVVRLLEAAERSMRENGREIPL